MLALDVAVAAEPAALSAALACPARAGSLPRPCRGGGVLVHELGHVAIRRSAPLFSARRGLRPGAPKPRSAAVALPGRGAGRLCPGRWGLPRARVPAGRRRSIGRVHHSGLRLWLAT